MIIPINRQISKPQEEIIATRENGLIVARDFDRVMSTFNKVLKYKENYVKSLEFDLQGLEKSLKDNLGKQNVCNRYFKIVDNKSEKIRLELQHLKEEERTHVVQYKRLLGGMGIQDENQELEKTPVTEGIPANGEDNGDILETFGFRKESCLESLNQEFDIFEEKLGSIENVRNELKESCNELKDKRVKVLKKKEALEDQVEKLFHEIGRVESKLETTIREVNFLTEEYVKMVKQVENALKLDEKLYHVLFSSLTLAESAETSSASEPSKNGYIKLTNFLKRVNKK